MSEAFGRPQRVRKRREFLQAYDQGRKVHGRYLMVFVVPNGRPTSRLGVSATRKIGGAVRRNLAKRRLREVFRRADLPQGVDVVVVPKREFFDAEWDALRNDFLTAFRRGCLPPGPGARRGHGL